jgi:predicted permease
MVIGMVIGISGIPVPQFIQTTISSAGSCMSPVAMLLTGMTIAQFDLKSMLRIKGVYISTFLRLVVYPMVFLGITMLLPKAFATSTFAICAICALSMPTGLTAIIVPAAYGKDTKIASGMALVSHVLSCITIPVIFLLFQMLSA